MKKNELYCSARCKNMSKIIIICTCGTVNGFESGGISIHKRVIWGNFFIRICCACELSSKTMPEVCQENIIRGTFFGQLFVFGFIAGIKWKQNMIIPRRGCCLNHRFGAKIQTCSVWEGPLLRFYEGDRNSIGNGKFIPNPYKSCDLCTVMWFCTKSYLHICRQSHKFCQIAKYYYFTTTAVCANKHAVNKTRTSLLSYAWPPH